MLLVAGAVVGLWSCAGGAPARRPERPLDIAIANAAAAAQAAFARGLCELAASYYGQALNRARAADNAEAIGNYAYNRAVCMIAIGELDQARALLDEAEQELNRAGVPLADVLLVQAQLAYHYASQDKATLAAVEATAQRVLTDPRAQPNAGQRAQVALLLAEVACRQGNLEAAERQLTTARLLSDTALAAGLQAGLARAAGCVDLARQQPAEAGVRFDEEAEWLRAGQRYADMARALRRAAGAYRQAGLLEKAAERYYRAARSWLGQGDSARAKEDLESARALAGQLQNKRLQRLIDDLHQTTAE